MLTVDARFCGPPGAANGGYLAGLIAEAADSPMQITLRRPVPLDTELRTSSDGDTRLVFDRHGLVVEAVPCTLELDVPGAPDFETATEASTRYVALERHPFPRCFVCGTHRDPGDGLRIFAGPLRDRSLVAAPWVPDVGLADGDGRIGGRILWAALDCPGAYASMLGRPPVAQVLGRIAGRVQLRPEPGERCVVVGWPIGHDGRKHHVGTAIMDSAGRLCALARATWFDVDVDIPETRPSNG